MNLLGLIKDSELPRTLSELKLKGPIIPDNYFHNFFHPSSNYCEANVPTIRLTACMITTHHYTTHLDLHSRTPPKLSLRQSFRMKMENLFFNKSKKAAKIASNTQGQMLLKRPLNCLSLQVACFPVDQRALVKECIAYIGQVPEAG